MSFQKGHLGKPNEKRLQSVQPTALKKKFRKLSFDAYVLNQKLVNDNHQMLKLENLMFLVAARLGKQEREESFPLLHAIKV